MSAMSKFARLIALLIALLMSACLAAVVLIRNVLAITNQAIDQSLARMFLPNTPLGAFAKRVGMNVRTAEELEPIHPLDEFARMLWKSRLTKEQVDRIIAIFPEIRHPLFPAVSADLSQHHALQSGRLLDKWEAAVEKVIAEHGGEEFVIRKALFAAILDRKLHIVGTSLEEMIGDAFIPAGIEWALKESVEETLYRVFALPPKGPRALDRFFRAVHLPVFMCNAAKLITEYAPTAGLRLVRPISRAKIAEGDFSPLSREIIGTALSVTVFVWLTS